jgi:ribosomal protein S6--L-glutamate ligase
VSFLGGEYLATYARQGSGKSWDTTTRTGGKYVPYEPSEEIIDLAYKAQSLFEDMAFTCVDVVETPDGPQLYEVSAFGGFRGLLEANNIDVADRYVDYVLEKIK